MSFTFVNRRWIEFTGRSLEQEVGRGWLASVHPEDVRGYLDEHFPLFASPRQTAGARFASPRRSGQTAMAPAGTLDAVLHPNDKRPAFLVAEVSRPQA